MLRGRACRWVSWRAASVGLFDVAPASVSASAVVPAPGIVSALAPVVLVHGFAQGADSWDEVAALLAADGRAVYALDLVGHGGSCRPEDPAAYCLDEQAATLLAFLGEVVAREGARPIVVGYSLGGRVALATACCGARAMASCACALVLESAGLGPVTPEERRAAAERDAMCASRLRAEGLEAFMDWWERLPLFASQRDLPEGVRARLHAGRLANDVEALARTFERAGQHAMPARADALAALTTLDGEGVSLLYLAGGRDEKYRVLAEGLPTVVALVVPAVGHNVHLEAPMAFVQAVRAAGA